MWFSALLLCLLTFARSEWAGPLRVWLAGVDTLHPGLRLRSVAAASEPPPPPTMLVGADARTSSGSAGGGGGCFGRGSGGVTNLAFEQPVRLRPGFECSLAVQIEPRRSDPRSPDGRSKPPTLIGAGQTTLAVYDDPEPMYDVVSPRHRSEGGGGGGGGVGHSSSRNGSSNGGGAPAPSAAADPERAPAASIDAWQPPLPPPPRVAVRSPRVPLSPRSGAYYGAAAAASPRYGDALGDGLCSPSDNSLATANHRRRHGGLS